MSGILRSGVALASGQMAVAALQAAQFFLIARALGPGEFGKVAGVMAIIGALMPFAGLGTANVMVMHLAQGTGTVHTLFGNALAVATASGAILIALAVLGGAYFTFEEAWLLLLLFGASELLFSKHVDVCAHVFYGLDRHPVAGALYTLAAASRLVAAVFFATAHPPSPSARDWALIHLASGSVASTVLVTWTALRIRPIGLQAASVWQDVRRGVFFSVSLSARSVYTDSDKAILARFAPLQDGGAYTAAYRVVSMAITPALAILLAAQTKMYRNASGGGLDAALAVTTRLLRPIVAYAGILAVAIFFCAPVMPVLLGPGYGEVVSILQALALLPILQLVQSAIADTLMVSGRQHLRSAVQVMAAVFSVALNLLLVPQLSWCGAVVSAYLTQAFLLLLVWILVCRHRGTKD